MFLFRRGGVARGQGCPGGGVAAQRIRDPSGDSVSKNSGRPSQDRLAAPVPLQLVGDRLRGGVTPQPRDTRFR